jgi:hypothetical protein
MLTSLTAKMGLPALRDTGLPQQLEIFAFVRHGTGRVPPVLDAEDMLRNPRGMLERFCAAMGVPFSERMLTWPPGRRATDGIWAKHWYEAVERSTGFEPYRSRPRTVAPELAPLLEECMPLYEELRRHRLAEPA